MAVWSAAQYLKFEDERTRPPRDLLAQVPLSRAARVVDMGCGPGNSTELLVAHFPEAEVIGLDSSPTMLEQARERLPKCKFVEADLSCWVPTERTDLLFGNAVFHWVPDHPGVMTRLLSSLPPGGVLAVQMPDNTSEPALMLMEKVWHRLRRRALRATTCRARKTITICCVRSVGISISGISTTTTLSRTIEAWWNGSRVRECGRFSRR